MSSTGKAERTERGYALIFVVIIAAAVATAVGTIAAVSHVEARASVQNLNSTKAYAMAYAGLQHALATARHSNILVALDGRDPSTQTPCPGNAGILNSLSVTISGTIFHNVSQRTATNPGGLDTLQAYTFGNGGYRLFLDDDYTEPSVAAGGDPGCDENFAVVLSSYGWYGTGENRAEALVETTFRTIDLGNFPGAITGCLASDRVDVSYESKQGPGWEMIAFRLDGNGRPPLAFNYDPFRANGLSIEFKSNADMTNHFMFRDNPERPTVNYRTGGPYQYGWPGINPAMESVLDASSNVGTVPWGYGAAPFGLADHGRIYINNLNLLAAEQWVPEAGAASETAGGVLSDAPSRVPYNTPIIAYKKAPAPVERAEIYFNTNVAAYQGQEEKFANQGFYACNSDKSSMHASVGICASGTDNVADAAPVWDDPMMVNSGLAWNVVQTVLRKCEYSGARADCVANFTQFENVAKCLILPSNVERAGGVASAGDTGGDEARYKDGPTADDDNPPSVANGHTWYPGGYPLTRLTGPQAVAIGLGGDSRVLAQFGLCATDTSAHFHVKYCNPETRLDTKGNSCPNSAAAWTTDCLSIEQATSDTTQHLRRASLPVGDYFKRWPGADTCPATGCNFAAVKTAFEMADWGDFTRCDDSCSFEHDGINRTNGSGFWRSVCINLDPYHVHQYGARYHYNVGTPDYVEALHPTLTKGERGSSHFIVRLDLTDNGPLGYCNQGPAGDPGTCLTGGANYSAGAPAQELNNLTHHPRERLLGLFSPMPPANDPWVLSVKTDADFCDQTSEASAQLFDALEELSENPDVALEGMSGDQFLGVQAADCVYDTNMVGPNVAGYYIKKCDEPVVVSWKKDAALGGNLLCGCGLLVVKYKGGKGKMRLDSNADEALVWRGMIVLHSNASGAEIVISANKSRKKSLFLDGGFLAIETGNAPKEFKIRILLGDKNTWGTTGTNAQTNVFVRYNPVAINEALSALDLSYNAYRTYY